LAPVDGPYFPGLHAWQAFAWIVPLRVFFLGSLLIFIVDI
jgi:hypothetical protein